MVGCSLDPSWVFLFPPLALGHVHISVFELKLLLSCVHDHWGSGLFLVVCLEKPVACWGGGRTHETVPWICQP